MKTSENGSIEELKALRLELSSVDECIAKRLDGIIADLEIQERSENRQDRKEKLELFGEAIKCIPAIQALIEYLSNVAK